MTEPSTPPPSPSPRPRGKRDRSGGPQASHETGSGRTDRARTGGSGVQSPPRAATTFGASRWVLAAIVTVPLLALLVYNLVDASRTGSAKIGETFTQGSGVAVNVGAAQRYAPTDAPPVAPGEQVHQVIVAVNNPTDEPMSSSDFTITATVNEVAVPAVALDGPLPDTIEPGVQLNIPFRFTVKDGTSGDLQVVVKDPDGRTVYFTGTV